MELLKLKEELINIARCFYQERVKDGLDRFEKVLAMILQVPEFSEMVNPVMEALQGEDYVLLADIFYHEMAMRIV